jgi:hypothetical protein
MARSLLSRDVDGVLGLTDPETDAELAAGMRRRLATKS